MSDCIDYKALKAIESLQRPGKPCLLSRIVGLFKTESMKSIVAVQQGTQSEDLDIVRNAAHTLKSSSAYVGAHIMSQRCQELEKAALDDNIVVCIALGDSLESLFEDSCAELDQYISKAA